MVDIYERLLMLKRMPEDVLNLHSELNMRKSEKSKNILIICRSAKDAREALKGMAMNYEGECKVKLNKMILETKDRNIIFMPISRIDILYGLKYKEYYLEDEYNI